MNQEGTDMMDGERDYAEERWQAENNDMMEEDDMVGFKALVTVLRGHEDLAERWFAAHDVTVEAEAVAVGGGGPTTVGEDAVTWYVVTGRGAVLEALQRTRMFVYVEHRVTEWPMSGDITDPVLRGRR